MDTIPNKTVIHVWTHNFINKEGINTFGLGDLVRGTIGVLQYCEKNKYTCIIDISLHPVSEYFIVNKHKYSKLIEENKNAIQYIFPDKIDSFIQSELNHKDVVFFFSNCWLDIYDTKLSPYNRLIIDDLLTPNDSFLKYINQISTTIPSSDFSILHFRLGDSELIQHKDTANYTHCIDILNDIINTNKSLILVSDSDKLKSLIKETDIPVFMFNKPIAHIGYHTEQIEHTLFEFMLLKRAKTIYTYSVYYWTSGFVKIIGYLYDIQIINLYNGKRDI